MSLLQALDPARSAVVEACAGSGKTWLLVSRMLRLLLAGAAPSSILALTFTRKAAQEMHERLDDWLRLLALAPEAEALEFLEQRGLDAQAARAALPRARGLYEAVLTSEPGIAIDTFHGWFLRLIDLAPLAAPQEGERAARTVNPHGAALSDAPGQLLGEAWQRLAMRLARDSAESSEEAARLHAAFETLLREVGLFGTRGLLFDFAARRSEWWAYTAGDEDPAREAGERLAGLLDVDEEYDPVAEFVEVHAGACARYGSLLGKRTTKTDSDLAQRWTAHAAIPGADALARYECFKAVLLTKAGTVRSRKASKAQAGELGGAAVEQEFLDLHARLSEGLLAVEAALLDARIVAINSAAFVCGVALLEEFAQVKGDRRMIDFTDAEWLATQLLTGEEHAAYLQARLDARVRHLLLDEFQDTNPMQWAALKGWLAAYGGDAARPSVLLVGDPKQSIYRFRRADARIFDAAGRWLVDQWGAVHLPMNVTRRNARPVVDVVNALFAAEPAYERFREQGTLAGQVPGRVELWPLAQGSEKPGARTTLRNPLAEARIEFADMQVRREKEAQLIAARIGQLVGRMLVGEPGKQRPAHYGDVMVLMRKRGALPAIEAALRAAGIPFVTARQGGLLDTLEARDLYALIEFLVTPANNLALAHALKSPLFGASDADLVWLAGMGGADLPWWDRLLGADEPPESLARARHLIGGWREVAGLLPVHDLLDRIYHEAQVLPRYAQAMPDHLRDRALSNLEAFIALALQLEAGRFPSLPRFLEDLRSARRGDLNESPDEAPTAAGEVVRLMTVHGSKGLEAPVVFLADANSSSARAGGGALIAWPPEAEAPEHFSLITSGGVGRAREPLVLEEQAADAIEELNVLYVAMTRAKQLLVVTGVENRGADQTSAHARIGRALSSLYKEESPEPLPGAPLAWGTLPQVETPASPGPAVPPGQKTGAEPVEFEVPPIGTRRAQPSEAMLAGIQLHAVFQAMLDETDLGRPVPAVAQVAARTGVPLLLAADLLRRARDLSGLPVLARFFDRARFSRAANELEIISAGQFTRADRVVEFDREIWVLDYKARVTPEELPAYSAQISGYRDALRAIHAQREVRAALIDLAEGRLIEV
jgi:ATP-dependent helicase/nuclease subunit A